MEKIYWTNKNSCLALANILFETCGLEFFGQENSLSTVIVLFFGVSGNSSSISSDMILRNFGKTRKRDYVIDFIDYVQPLYVECTL